MFAAAGEGDAVARSIIDRLADELVVMAIALARRARLTRLPVEVVLAGGVFRTTDAPFYARLESASARSCPNATLVQLDVPPVAGAALHGLALAGAPASARDRVRADLRAWVSAGAA